MSSALRRLTTLATHLRRPTTSLQQSKLGSALSTSSSPAMSAAAKQYVDDKIKSQSVLVFGKSYCPYCHRAKAILQGETDQLDYIDIDKRDDGSEIQAYLKSLNGQGTVPHVYINHEFIGGCSDLQAIPSSQLKKKIQAAA